MRLAVLRYCLELLNEDLRKNVEEVEFRMIHDKNFDEWDMFTYDNLIEATQQCIREVEEEIELKLKEEKPKKRRRK